MSYVLHRNLVDALPRAVAGDGDCIVDQTGKRYLDACGGAAVSCLGHSDARVAGAVKRQIERLAFAHTSFFTNEAAEDLAERLVRAAPSGVGRGRAMFLGSGSEAMEAALKLARQAHLERGEPERRRIIARTGSYHGNTLGALAVSGHAARRAPYDPLLIEAALIEPCYAYRFRRDGETEAAFGLRMANQLEEKIVALGPQTVAVFVAEPVVGATLGSQPAAAGYFRRVREICDRHGVLFIADEVMCGCGRTGSFYALEQEDVAADITTIAKGLGAGYQPIAAVIASEAVCAAVAEGSGRLWNGHTYMSHAVACAGALAVLRVIEEDALLDNVRDMGGELEARLRHRFGGHDNVGDIRGRGLFWSLELVRDRSTKAPFQAGEALARRVRGAAMAEGLLCYPSQGCADGENGDHVLLAPAYATTSDELEQIVQRLGRAIEACLPVAA